MPEPFVVGERCIVGDKKSILSFIAIVLMAHDIVRGELSEEDLETEPERRRGLLERYMGLAERVLEVLTATFGCVGVRVPEEGLRFAHMLVRELHARGELNCLSCGSPLPAKMEYRPHGDGYYWCWVTCRKCGYQNALWKLSRRSKQREE